jgi:hypothetical protein
MGKRKNDQHFVRYAQPLLNAAGDFGLKETGRNDAAMQAAFKQIQSRLGFRLTGTATPETLAALQKDGSQPAERQRCGRPSPLAGRRRNGWPVSCIAAK